MPTDNESLHKINLEEDSILVPKIDVSQDSTKTPLVTPAKVPNSPPKKKGRVKPILFTVLGIVVVFLIYNLISGFLLYQKGTKLLNNVNQLTNVAKTQDLGKIKTEVSSTKNSLNNLGSAYQLISWEKFLPFVGPYIGDAGHAIKAGQAGLDTAETVLTVIQPYSDLLGFKEGSSSTAVLAAASGEQTTQERINFIVKTIPDLIPQVDLISGKVKIIQD